MVSIEQRRIMLEKLSCILKKMRECRSIDEISRCTGIPSSTIQRYLNREDLLAELFCDGVVCEATTFYIKSWLARAKKEGVSRGGKQSQKRYSYQRKKNGQFKEILR